VVDKQPPRNDVIITKAEPRCSGKCRLQWLQAGLGLMPSCGAIVVALSKKLSSHIASVGHPYVNQGCMYGHSYKGYSTAQAIPKVGIIQMLILGKALAPLG